MKSSRAISRVSQSKTTNVSGTVFVPIIRAMKHSLVAFDELKRPIAREDFINVSRHENITPYINWK
jgi:hypothetical protein